jgi:hypothetical protein
VGARAAVARLFLILSPIVPTAGASQPDKNIVWINLNAEPGNFDLFSEDVVIFDPAIEILRPECLGFKEVLFFFPSAGGNRKVEQASLSSFIVRNVCSRHHFGKFAVGSFEDGWSFPLVFEGKTNLDNLIVLIQLPHQPGLRRPYKKIGSLNAGYVFSGLNGGFGSIGSRPESAPQKISLRGENQKLEENNCDSGCRKPERISIQLSLFIMLFGIGLSFFLVFLSGKYLNDNRRIFGASLIGCGLLLCGLSLWLGWSL